MIPFTTFVASVARDLELGGCHVLTPEFRKRGPRTFFSCVHVLAFPADGSTPIAVKCTRASDQRIEQELRRLSFTDDVPPHFAVFIAVFRPGEGYRTIRVRRENAGADL